MTEWTALEQAAQVYESARAAYAAHEPCDEEDERLWTLRKWAEERFRRKANTSTILVLIAELREAQKARTQCPTCLGPLNGPDGMCSECLVDDEEVARLREQVQALQADHDDGDRNRYRAERDAAREALREARLHLSRWGWSRSGGTSLREQIDSALGQPAEPQPESGGQA